MRPNMNPNPNIKMNKIIPLIFILAVTFFSCSHRTVLGGRPSRYNVKLTLQDKSGKFTELRESGLAKNKKSYVTKYRVYSVGEKGRKILEQSIVFSTPGVLINKVRVLRPEKSQYKVWFDKRLYQTETRIDKKNKALIIKMQSPEKQWQGEKNFIFPGGNGLFCYFSQLFECMQYTGFIDKAIKLNTGKAEFYVIWDGYPYFQEQYLNISDGPFAAATMEYDGKTRDGEYRFSVSVSGNAIFYLYKDKDNNDQKNYVKMFWPSQGFSLFGQ